MPKQRFPSLLCLAFTCCLAACGGLAETGDAEQPAASDAVTDRQFNVVIVSLDTLRADHLGAYGYERDTSPNLDRLARSGVVFEQAIAQSSHTAPSHGALFQSRLVSHLSDDTPSLAETLARGGYRTAAFTGGGKMTAKLGFDRGFEIYEEDLQGFSASYSKFRSWLESAPESPFFLFLHTYDIHLPYDPPPPFDSYFLPDYQGKIDGQTGRDAIYRYMGMHAYEGAAQPDALPPPDHEKLVALYDGGIRYTDEYVGRLVELLKQQGLWDRTILVVLSDHGEEFRDHASYLHGLTLFQEVVRVPLIFRLPRDHFAGVRVDAPIALLDVKPTILQMIDVAPLSELQGRSLLPLMRGDSYERDAILSEIHNQRSLLRHPWKLVQVRREDPRLYHLGNDPDERLDLATEHPEIVGEMEQEIRRQLQNRPVREIEHVNPEDVEDPELREQLEALGYVGG